MVLTGTEDNSITFTEGAAMTAAFRKTSSAGAIIATCYSKDSIQSLLSQEGCKGIRAYYALNTSNVQCLVIVGVDENGNDQIGPDYNCIDSGFTCPTDCSESNILNS